jgi:cysteine-rich repeat protein
MLVLGCTALVGCGASKPTGDAGVDAGPRPDLPVQPDRGCPVPAPNTTCGQFVCVAGMWQWNGPVNCSRIGTCGNGQRDPNEECDDSNNEGGDGCSMLCQVEAGWECLNPGHFCRRLQCGDESATGCDGGAGGTCGDGILDTGLGEECDQGVDNGTTNQRVWLYPEAFDRSFACGLDCRVQVYFTH